EDERLRTQQRRQKVVVTPDQPGVVIATGFVIRIVSAPELTAPTIMLHSVPMLSTTRIMTNVRRDLGKATDLPQDSHLSPILATQTFGRNYAQPARHRRRRLYRQQLRPLHAGAAPRLSYRGLRQAHLCGAAGEPGSGAGQPALRLRARRYYGRHGGSSGD